MLSVAFPRLEDTLAEAGGTADAAEAHGTLSGTLCAGSTVALDDWLDELLHDPAGHCGECRAVFETVFSETAQSLGGGAMEFTPLLPDDDEPLAERTKALTHWCQGFLYGLGTGRLNSIAELPGEVGEAVHDLTEISRATPGEDDPTEDDEQAYAELVEYVRVSVQLIYDELEPLRATVRPASPHIH
jgi:yecA family protein